MSECYHFGPFQLDPKEREFRRGGESIPLTGKAFDLLLVLIRDPGRTIPKAELMTSLWGDTAVEESNLTQTVFLLRKALGDDSERAVYVQTVPRLGYKFVAPVTPGAIVALAAGHQKQRWLALGLAAGAAIMVAAAVLLGPGGASRPEAPTSTPFSFEVGRSAYPVWSPDGKAVAFGIRRSEADVVQLYVKYLGSSTAMQLTHGQDDATPVAWTTTGHIVFQSARPPEGLWSISPTGGEPEPILGMNAGTRAAAAHVSADGSAAAYYDADKDGVYGIWLSAPVGSHAKLYAPLLPATRQRLSEPKVQFSPDGKQILLLRGVVGTQFWLMPYPPDASNPPRRILRNLPPHKFTPMVSWMPDNRRIVLAMGPDLTHLYLADTESEEFSLLSSGGTTSQARPAVSPDGKWVVYQDVGLDQDLVTIDLANAEVRPLLATDRSEDLPAWAAKAPAMVYVTDRTGQPEILLHKPGEGPHTLVSSRDFPEGPTGAFMNPVLSPDGTRLAYQRVGQPSPGGMWLSSVAGGAPVRVSGDGQGGSVGSWSPDGAWIAFLRFTGDNTASLYKVKTTGQAQPELVKAGLKRSGSGIMPDWSPTGEWILNDDGGPRLISPDGKTERALGSGNTLACGFSRDGKLVYCMRQQRPNAQGEFYSVRVAGGPEKVIGSFAPENRPQPGFAPSLRMTLTPDGKSLTYSIRKTTSNLWMLEGIE